MGWPQPAAKLHTAAHSLPTFQWDGGQNWKSKSWKLMGKDKNSLIGEAKLHAQAMQNKEFIHYFPSAGRCLDTFLESRASACAMVTWEDKCHNHKHSPFLLSPSFYCSLCMRSYGMGYLFGQLSQLCPFPIPPACSGWRQSREKETNNTTKPKR